MSGFIWIIIAMIFAGAGIRAFLHFKEERIADRNAERARLTVLQTLGSLAESIIVVGFATLIFELPELQRYFQHQVKEVLAYERDFQDASFLKQRFSQESLRGFRSAINHATAASEPEAAMLDSLCNLPLHGVIGKELRIVREQRVQKSPSGMEYLLVIEDVWTTWESGVPDTMTGPGNVEMDRISGIDNSDLQRIVLMEINGVSVSPPPRLAATAVGPGRVRFRGAPRIPVMGEVVAHWKLEKRIAQTGYWKELMGVPMETVMISLHFDEAKLSPELHMFSAAGSKGAVTAPIEQATGSLRWEHRGWLLRSEGWMVTWRAIADRI